MFSIDEAYVQSAAPNSEAMKNGRALVVKGKFIALHFDADETILFGQCQGPAKSRTNVRATLRSPISRRIAALARAVSFPASIVWD